MADRLTLRQILRLYALYAHMDLDWLLRDTRFALMAVVADTLSIAAGISGIFLLAWRFDGVGGMSRWEVLLMLGYVTCVNGLYSLFCSNCNTGHISRRIGRGQFDHMIVQPLPFAVQLATEGFLPFTGSQNLLFGLGIVAWAVHGLGLPVSWLWVLAFPGLLLVSLAVIVGITYVFSALAFWRPVAFEEIASTINGNMTGELSRYPLSVLPTGMRLVLITAMPAGLMGWFPVCALLGKPPLGLSAFFPLAVAAVLWILANWAMRKGLRHYAKTGSNRYSAMGHRR